MYLRGKVIIPGFLCIKVQSRCHKMLTIMSSENGILYCNKVKWTLKCSLVEKIKIGAVKNV
ncbi:hypothetical protein WQ57_12960 [Mesobacillus campisalis]|uniref:Uncharacterized protein n=1 Tax=Mesobacillus campisalis TaxID=1408103 RepID=A0A0M2SU22_9BACI|nr:hypothetical protein WQ57_12960 [Mesobacillus campisalis]